MRIRCIMKGIRRLCAGLFCLSLMSCIDIVQHITRNEDGSDQNTICITVSKELFEAANNMGGDGPLDYEEFLGEEFGTIDSTVSQYGPIDVTATVINDDLNFGYFVDMNINYKDKRVQKLLKSEELEFVPIYKKNMMEVRIGSLNNDDFNSVFDSMLLSTCKYRLLVSKSCIPTVRTVVLRSENNSLPIPFFDLHDEYLIEAPFSLLVNENVSVELYR